MKSLIIFLVDIDEMYLRKDNDDRAHGIPFDKRSDHQSSWTAMMAKAGRLRIRGCFAGLCGKK